TIIRLELAGRSGGCRAPGCRPVIFIFQSPPGGYAKLATSQAPSSSKIKIGIVGGTGYTGVELLRLLATHPQADLQVITSRGEAGVHVADLFPSLRRSEERRVGKAGRVGQRPQH